MTADLRSTTHRRTFRPELHGTRGLAILLIVVFHIVGDGRVSGGIDVFLAITGFLAIPSLMRRAQAGGGGWRLDLGKRFSDLFRRLAIPLLPPLIFVGVAGWFILPASALGQMLSEIMASALFYENWALVSSQMQYDAAGAETSPLQHIWSTSIQGQFHLAMTFLVMILVFVAVRMKRTAVPVVITALVILTAASFGWAIYDTATSQITAYFSTFSRAWQLTGPAILGLTIDKIHIPQRARAAMSWVGIAMMVSCGFLLDGAANFPGPLALWPVVGVSLILAAGTSGRAWGGDRILLATPLQRLGDISYSLYLWHWPILIFALAVTGQTRANAVTAVVVIALSLAAGFGGKALFEDRLANIDVLKPAVIAVPVAGAVVWATVATTSHFSAIAQDRVTDELLAAHDHIGGEDYPGGAALAEDLDVAERPVVPDADSAADDMAWHYEVNRDELCIPNVDDTRQALLCDDGNPDDGRPHIVIVGGSHAGQWSTVMRSLGEEHGWKTSVMARSNCMLTTDQPDNPAGLEMGADCEQWNDNAIGELMEMEPDLVVALGTTRRADAVEAATPGMLESFQTITDADIPLLLFRENPAMTGEFEECVMENFDDPRHCSAPRTDFYDAEIDANGIDVDLEGAVFFDTSQYLCQDECAAVVGNVRLLYDDHHLTASMTLTLQPYIENELRQLAPELFESAQS